MSADLSDPLVGTGFILGLAGLILVVGLALQLRAIRRDETGLGFGSRPFWQESADVGRERRDEAVAAAPAPFTNDPVQEDLSAAISPIDELEERLNTWVERIEAEIAPAQEPQEPITNDQPPEGERWIEEPEDQRRIEEPEDQRRIEEPAAAEPADGNGSDGGRERTATPKDVASKNGVQDKDRRWLEEFIARSKAAEESCGRTDDAATRVSRLIGPPPSGSAD